MENILNKILKDIEICVGNEKKGKRTAWKKIGGMEFYDVNFSYIDNETFEEEYVPVPEQAEELLFQMYR